MTAGRRFLFLASDYASFVSHKAPLTRVALRAGFDVVVAANRRQSPAPDLPGVKVVDLSWRRGGSAIGAAFRMLSELSEIRALLAAETPAVVHAIDLKPAIVASLAMPAQSRVLINSINGLGFIFTDSSRAARWARQACARVLKRATDRGATIVAQNRDDAATLAKLLDVDASALTVIRGSGVDPAAFPVAPLPEARPFRVLLLSRLLRIKGIADAVAAVQIVRAQGVDIELVIAGAPDPGNPSSISPQQLDEWSRIPGVQLLGHVAEVRSAIAGCHVVMQPSLGGEGLPRSLLEAASSGRALIATDVPGNRDIAVDGVTGWLAPPGRPDMLAHVLAAAVGDLDACRQRGLAARALMEREFSLERIEQAHSALYRSVSTLDS